LNQPLFRTSASLIVPLISRKRRVFCAVGNPPDIISDRIGLPNAFLGARMSEISKGSQNLRQLCAGSVDGCVEAVRCDSRSPALLAKDLSLKAVEHHRHLLNSILVAPLLFHRAADHRRHGRINIAPTATISKLPLYRLDQLANERRLATVRAAATDAKPTKSRQKWR
jgi:hypothetical protein